MIRELIQRARYLELRPREVLQHALKLDGTPEVHGIVSLSRFLKRWHGFPGVKEVAHQLKGRPVTQAFVAVVHADGIVLAAYDPSSIEVCS